MPARFQLLFFLVTAGAAGWARVSCCWRASQRAPGGTRLAALPVASGALDGLMRGLLAKAGCVAAGITAWMTDTKHRGQRAPQRMALASIRFKQLDAGADLACRDGACGSSGAALLRIGNLDPYRRDAALLAPGTEV
ncbi:hypothetical protein [Pseudoduganella armeniaca]|uniref:Uncharacterized protein n=1 Tax=Pseudoduganella armeniaca TaxID=2072590 RepID=A0A2R4CAZ5_9BURK|nr:hypothetical protein [Pseudoduganella armeniaca]AVR96807.1 hypothetical protein C9I28_14840 [Pseudoduganella armeniaca]